VNKYDIKKHVTAIPAKTLALCAFIGQGVNCEVLDVWLKFFFLFPSVFIRIKHRNASI